MSQAAGWYRDPFFREQERYWDGRMWTQGTRPAGAEPVGAGAGAGAGEVPGAGASSDEQPTPSDGVNDAMERLAAALEPAAAAPAEPPPPQSQSFAPLGAPVQPGVAPPAGGPATWAPPMAGTAMPQQGRRDGHRRAAIFAVAAAALLFVAGGVSAALVLGGSGNASAQEAVANAATQTFDAQSADMSMSIDVSALGVHESVTANGAFNFAQKTGTMTMTIPVEGKQFTEQEIIDGSTVYLNVSGLQSGLTTGKPWISENVGQMNSGNSSVGGLDPTSMLQQLQTNGGTVTSLGPTTYDGTPVTEYAATLPASALQAEIGKLPSSLQQGVSGLNLPDMHMNVYVTQDNLLKAIALPSYSITEAGQSLSMDMAIVFSNYGTTVNVTPPPANEVAPLSQSGLGGSSGSTGSTGGTGSTI